MQIVEKTISIDQLAEMASKMFGNMVKAVVDVKKEILVVDAGMHSDEERFLLSRGSEQKDLWGINIYPDKDGDGMIEFDSMINLRPLHGNNSRGVDAEDVRERIKKIVLAKITK